MNLLILISFFVLTALNYAEYPWVISNIKAHKAAIKDDFNNAMNHYKKSNEILNKESKYEQIELLLTKLKIMRFKCLAGKQVSVEQLAEFTLSLGHYYDPLQIKLFDDLHKLCFELYKTEQYKSCWWLLQRVQKMYLNGHNDQELQSLKIMRIGLQSLAMLAIDMLESTTWSKFISRPDRRKELWEEKLSDAEILGCGLASLKRASIAFKNGKFSLSVSKIKISVVRLQHDINYLLKYLDKNQIRMSSSHNLFTYLRTLIYGIQELRDLLELTKDKVNLTQYFSELSTQSINSYLIDLDHKTIQNIEVLKKLTSEDFMRSYGKTNKESFQLCNGSMVGILKGLRLHNIDHGFWLEFDASDNFEKAYRYLKSLAADQYMDFISRQEMRKCFSTLKFKYPSLNTDYHNLAIK